MPGCAGYLVEEADRKSKYVVADAKRTIAMMRAAKERQGGRALTCLLVLGNRQLICKRSAIPKLKTEGVRLLRTVAPPVLRCV